MIIQYSSIRFYKAIGKFMMNTIAHPRFVKDSELNIAKASIKTLLSNHKVVLASGSPRRQEILQLLGLNFVVIPSTFEENLDVKDFENSAEFVKETAKQKALEVSERIKEENIEADLVISADTVVECNNEIFGKPKNTDNATVMLSRLSGKTHQVISGVTLIFPPAKKTEVGNSPLLHTFHDTTDVVMNDMTPEIIKQYVETGEPIDKAGGYGIQGKGNELINNLCGDYFNVVGFPLFKFHEELTNLHKNKIV